MRRFVKTDIQSDQGLLKSAGPRCDDGGKQDAQKNKSHEYGHDTQQSKPSLRAVPPAQAGRHLACGFAAVLIAQKRQVVRYSYCSL